MATAALLAARKSAVTMPSVSGNTAKARANAMLAQQPSSGAATPPPGSTNAKARAAAVDFESVYLSTMFQQMFTGVDGDGPMGNAGGTGVWRSFLTDQYARTVAQSGGIGIADHVYRALLATQEAR